MKDNSLVSVIIPVYNAEKYLSRCIESILRQTHSSFELILINDGSTDRSSEICNEYALQDRRIKVIHITNNGPGNARNIGLKNSRGEFIQFTDSDDTLPSNFLEVMLHRMEYENSDLVVCGSKILRKNDEIDVLNIEDLIRNNNKTVIKMFIDLLDKGLAYSSWNKLYRKDIIDENNIFFGTEFNLGEDAIFNISYIKKTTKLSLENKVFYEYHQNEGSLVNKYYDNKFEIQILLYSYLKELINEVSNSNNVNETMYLYYQYEFTFVLINYYLPSCPMNSLERKKMINSIIQDNIVQEIFKIPNHRSNLQKIIRRFVRIKNASMMDIFLRAYRRRYL